jgi:nickel/cobalt transporter (NiCoT) family protein
MRFTLNNVTGESSGLRRRIFGVYTILLAFNVSAWLWAVLAFHANPVLMGTALLAYSLGLRHAVDADHIAAIDNVTRKLVQTGKRPVGVGLMFSLGHSTIVLVGAAAIAGTALALQDRLNGIRDIGSLIGTFVSAFFLFAIGIVNLVVLRSIYFTFVRVRSGKPYVEEDFDMLLGNRGFLSRLFRPMFRIITETWHMYPLGLLFGLGFDTATEIGVLGLSAAGVSSGLSFGSILVFPVLFAAGMSLIDTTDSILMLGAYGWAFVKPIRKLYYNLTITGISVTAAFAVGGIEVLALLVGRLHPKTGFLVAIARLNGHFGTVGYFMVGVFALTWIVSIAVYAWHSFDRIGAVQPGQQASSD